MRRPITASAGVSSERGVHVLDADGVCRNRAHLTILLRGSLRQSISGRAFDINAEVAATLDFAECAMNARVISAQGAAGLVGVAIGSVDESGTAFIRWVAVAPSVRQCGIGGQLVDVFETASCARRVRGWVNHDDPVALGFWLRRGWQPLGAPPHLVMMGRELLPRPGA